MSLCSVIEEAGVEGDAGAAVARGVVAFDQDDLVRGHRISPAVGSPSLREGACFVNSYS